MHNTGIIALITLISHLFFILLAFNVIQDIHIERHIRMHAAQGKMLIVFLSIALGYLCSSFFLDLINEILNLQSIVK